MSCISTQEQSCFLSFIPTVVLRHSTYLGPPFHQCLGLTDQFCCQSQPMIVSLHLTFEIFFCSAPYPPPWAHPFQTSMPGGYGLLSTYKTQSELALSPIWFKYQVLHSHMIPNTKNVTLCDNEMVISTVAMYTNHTFWSNNGSFR